MPKVFIFPFYFESKQPRTLVAVFEREPNKERQVTLMKKLVSLLLCAIMLCSMASAVASTEFDVTEPITITW